MRTPTRLRVSAAVAAVAIAALSLSACSSSASPSNGKPNVVASTDVYGAIATAVAGDNANVTSLFHNPTGDPHEYEATAQDTAALRSAALVVYNGGHYDAYVEKSLKGSSVPTINAFVDKTGTDDDQSVNEHMFYDLPTIKEVAQQVADKLAQIDAKNKASYEANAQKFDAGIDGIIATLGTIKSKYAGEQVAQTEPLAHYLLQSAGLKDATPTSFTDAIEEGSDPAPADIATTNALITGHKVKALLLNIQTEDAVTRNLNALADRSGVPVVKLTESLPAGVTDYLTWQRDNVEQIAKALS